MPDDGGGGGQERSADGVMSPDDLDITDDESVVEIEDGRYVIGTGGGPPRAAPNPDTQRDAAEGRTADAGRPDVNPETVYAWLAADLDDATSQYGFDVTATFNGQTDQHRLLSNDVVTIFESLVLWYAQGIDSTTPVEEVLGILLMEANVPVRYPPGSLRRVLESTDLSPDDTIADLMAAVGDEDGFRL